MVALSTYITLQVAGSMTAHLMTVLRPFSLSLYSPPVTTTSTVELSATHMNDGVAGVFWLPSKSG